MYDIIKKKILKEKKMIGTALKFGDVIGIIAPSGCTKPENIKIPLENLKKLGFNIKLGESCVSSWYKFAGTDETRGNDINKFFLDKEVDGIMCLRGGYGSNRILKYIDFNIIRNNPKVFVGFSDITSLHTAINTKTGLITFHGPMLTSNLAIMDNKTNENFLETVMVSKKKYNLENIEELKVLFYGTGKATGRVVGGNLITLGALLKTEYDFDYEDKILFIEEINEKSYKIDRVLQQMSLLGILKKIKGVILGDFNSCEKDSSKDMNVLETFQNYFEELNIPVLYNYKSGHCIPMMTIPIGIEVEMDTNKRQILVLEEVVR